MPLQVQSKACSSCIYGKNSASMRSVKELEKEIADKNMEGFFKSYRQCHHSNSACCRGFWNRHKDHFALGQIAQRLDCVEFVTHKVGN